MAIRAIALLVLSTPDVFEVPLDVAQHYKIKETVIIQVHPSGARRPTAPAHAAFFGDVSERPISVVVGELIAAVCRYIHAFVTVVVVVADRYSHTIACTLQASLLRDILKCAIVFLVIEAIPVIRPCLLRNGSLWRGIFDGSAIYQENVQPPIVVIIEQSHSRSHGLEQVMACGVGSDVLEMYAEGRGDIREPGLRCLYT